ncbi:amidohydrolase [Amycolatopsis magusensis]|uniref:amidohydrolase n=1 Tax=Amycolatopsis magusensis TaxID=882444 RepID=UPI0024A7B037|nr:amidohydrolase [Amycolatopsis magusensis]MDI5982123.1 amidohydrolase [Amycolatopsis magusensis]
MRTLHHLERSALDATATILLPEGLVTVDDATEGAEAVLVFGDQIAAVGSVDACHRASAGLGHAAPEVRRLSGTLLPGFVDPHAHPLMYGQMMTWVDCGPGQAASIPEIVALLRAAAERTPADRPVRGYGYEHRNLAEKRHPRKEELDAVATDREVYLMNASGHGGVVNSFTLARNGVTRDTPDPDGGVFFRDEHGELTGELSDAACNILTGVSGVKVGHHGPNFHLADEPAEHLRQLAAAQEKFLAAGVTSIGDAQVTRREFDMYLRLAEAGQLTTRVHMYLLSHLLDQALEMGLHGAFGNSHLSFAGIKFYADGTLGGWTAYFPDGYVGDPCRTGQLYHEPADYTALIEKAHAAGLQTATHAQSPAAIGMVLDALESAQRRHPRDDARHRIEHCGLPSPQQIHRMAALGVHPVNQPQHYYNWGEGVTDAVGTPGERFNPLGEFQAAGVPVTLSSDAPVAEPNPLEAIQTAVTRVTRRGHRLGGDELLIDARSAVAAHTIAGARALGRERDLGSITPGKRADFVLLAENPLTTEPGAIADIRVLATWVGGEVHHRHAAQESAR